jgi:hypothetical protein
MPFQTPWRQSDGSNPRVNAATPSCRNIFETPSAVLRYMPMYALLCIRTCGWGQESETKKEAPRKKNLDGFGRGDEKAFGHAGKRA